MVMIYTMLPLLMVPLGFAFVVGAILSNLRRLRAASDPCEKAHWSLRVAAHTLFAYGLAVIGLLAADGFRGEPWRLAEWWPLVTRSWHWSKNETVIALTDVLTLLIAALGSLGLAHYFGHVDGSDVWRAPGWRKHPIRNERGTGQDS